MNNKLIVPLAIIALASTSCRSVVSVLSRQPKLATQMESIKFREPMIKEIDTPAKTLYLKIDRLARNITDNSKDRGGKNRLLISTFVDLDRLYRTNTFGRYIAEQLMESLSARGFTVIEPRAAKELMVQPNIGEMALTRDSGEMMNKYQADAIILGTYKKLGNTVTVNARMVVAKNQKVVSVANMRIEIDEKDKFMRSMFKNELDRISLQGDIEGF